MDFRQQRGLEIAATCKINQKNGTWLVPSQSGHGRYAVFHDPEKPTCTCPDHETRGCKCKHIFAVEYVIKREGNPNGKPVVAESLTCTKRKTYPQDWTNYNKAQMNEKEQFRILLADLCKGIPQPPQKMGRPKISLADMVFIATYKVYSTVSGRRFSTDLREAKDKGFIAKAPHYNSIFRFFEDARMIPILKNFIAKSSVPLAVFEHKFAIDSSGFSSSRFDRWFDEKYGGYKKQHAWVKAHLMCGVKTNVVTAVEILDKDAGDAPRLPSLVKKTAKTFEIHEVSADKAYLSLENIEAVFAEQAVPFIPFKSNATSAVGGLYAKLFHCFMYCRETFLEHYHQRSNVESTFAMIKAKFGDSVRSKTDVAQKNEVLCKVLTHNICCVISAMYELGVSPEFSQTPAFTKV